MMGGAGMGGEDDGRGIGVLQYSILSLFSTVSFYIVFFPIHWYRWSISGGCGGIAASTLECRVTPPLLITGNRAACASTPSSSTAGTPSHPHILPFSLDCFKSLSTFAVCVLSVLFYLSFTHTHTPTFTPGTTQKTWKHCSYY